MKKIITLVMLAIAGFSVNSQTAYITNSHDSTVSVINVATNTVTATITVGTDPYGVSVSPDGSKVYVANYNANTVSVIDSATNTVSATIHVGTAPFGISISPNGTEVYVANEIDNTVSVINTATNTVSATITVGSTPNGVSVSPDGSKVYVTNTDANTVSVIASATNTVSATIAVGADPLGVSVSPDGSKVYVANSGDGTVSVINTATNTVTATIPAGGWPYGLSVSPDGSKVYVTNIISGTVSVINTTTNTDTATIPVGDWPYGLSVSPDGSKVYVANQTDSTVSVIDAATNTVTATITVGVGPVAFGNFISTHIQRVVSISKTDASCYGCNNGTAIANPSGGSTPYSFHWSNGGTSQSIIGLIAGTYTVTVTDAVACTATGSVTIKQFGKPYLTNIVPSTGGNTGDLTATIYGAGFGVGDSVKLTRAGYAAIVVPDSMMSFSGGQRINATFNLNNQDTGLWNVVVKIPGDTVMTLANGFEITNGGVAEPYADVNGFTTIRANEWQNYTIICGNRGNVNAVGVPLWIIIPQNVDLQLSFPAAHFQNTSNIDYDTISYSVNSDTLLGQQGNFRAVPIFVPVIAPNQVLQLNIKLRSPVSQTFKISTWVGSPLYQNSSGTSSTHDTHGGLSSTQNLLSQDAVNCYLDAAFFVMKQVPGYGCVAGLLDYGWRGIINQVFYGQQLTFSYLEDNFVSTVQGCIDPDVQDAIMNSNDILKAISMSQDVSDDVSSITNTIHCAQTFLPQSLNSKIDMLINTVTSFDPNDKTGPIGSGINNYINANNPLSYAIHFENSDSATASVQGITIIDTLDKNVFNLSTFQLGYISFGDTIINVPNGSKTFKTNVDLRPKNNNIIVSISAGLNDTTGVLTWKYTSLDPSTLLPTINPLAGFLPPNIIAPEGEGSVFYSVKLKDSISFNSIVTNKAYIYFDSNSVVPTNNWANTIDNIKPHSRVDSLPLIETDTLFTVSWSGVDTGSGIKDYSIYVALNSGTYQPWLLHTTITSAIYTGIMDSTYRFYSIAYDSAGNVESAPFVADAKTTITIATKVNNIYNGYGLKIFPNPANDNITIENTAFTKNQNISVYNIQGELLLQQSMLQAKTNIDISAFAKGIYYVEVKTENDVAVKKFVKE